MNVYAVVAMMVVLADEWLKHLALSRLPGEAEITEPGLLTFAIHKNWGIAFDIPFKLPIILLISTVIGFFLVRVVWMNFDRRPAVALSALLIIIGALGNLYDRVVYGFTVDYIILFGRSAINLSDIVILAGVFSLLITSRHGKHDAQQTSVEKPIDK